ncbi:amidohydrolase [Clostridia bacterium OttesenSCG-928-O13]|nr:amidohydrolase [Clostridia bacterium OttesenSCG-928-O13]
MKKRGRLSLVLALVLALAAVLGACATPTEEDISGIASSLEEALTVDIYFENGVIYTADDKDSMAEALAIQDGEIVFVGSAADGVLYKEAAAEVVDLEGKMMMPGLIDGHIHSLSPDFFDFSLVGILTKEDTMAAIESYVQENPDKETYFGYGYMATVFEGEELTEGPKKERLDEICPDKPMVIYSYDGHAAWLNTKALAYCGITAETESTPGGSIVKDNNGELWGILHDSAMSFTGDFPLDQETVKTALKEYMYYLNSLGYTSIMTPPGNGFFPVPFDAYQAMADNNELSMRVRGAGIITSWNVEEDLKTLAKLQQQYNSGQVQVIGAKLFMDGVMDNESAFLLQPYVDKPDYYGVAGWEIEALNQAVYAVNEMGLLAHIHSMGDAATRACLDAFEYSQGKLGSNEFRNALTHLQLINKEDIPRFRELGIVAVTDPYWHYKAPFYWEEKEHAVLGERAEHMYPMRSFVENDVALAFASDFPVTPLPNPFIAIETGVTRNLADGAEYDLPNITDMDAPDYLLWPEERLEVMQMLRGYTIGGAYSMFVEDETGSLEVGKSADMIIIDQNLLTVAPLEIKDTLVLGTYFAGQLVYSAQE